MKEQPPVEKPATKRVQIHSPFKKMMLWWLALFIAVWLGAGAVLLIQNIGQSSTSSVAERQVPERDGNIATTDEEVTIDNVIEKVSPSVVSVLTEVDVESFYFGSSVQEGAGSGIIVSEDGYIITNKHVIDNARQVTVVLDDGTTYENVEVVTVDPLNDLAFLKLSGASGLKVAELGDATTVRVGQRVIAIGNSLGQYQNTVTSGIISGTGRPVSAQKGDEVETLTDLLQTDAAINPGNSGGPLLNTSGQVIGVNTAIAADAEGIGFAIPITAAKGILKQVLAGQDAKRAYLGVRYIPVNAAIAKKFDLSVATGAYVYAENGQAAVVRDSPADQAGIKAGDIITKVGDVSVGASGGVASLVAEYAPGDVVELTVVRGEDTKKVSVSLASY